MAIQGFEVGTNGRRRRNVIRGEVMLTPESTFTWDGVVFKAGVTRVAPDHPVAESEFADLLRPAYEKESSPEVLRFLERRLAGRTATRGEDGDRPYWYLGPISEREARRLRPIQR